MPKGFIACGEIKQLYPPWLWVRYHMPWKEFQIKYNQQLALLDVNELAKKCDGKILCCFERDLKKDHCHRELLKEWFIKNGYKCEEWVNPKSPPQGSKPIRK